MVIEKVVKVKMVNDSKRQEVYEILMMPVECTEYSDRIPNIKRVGSTIKTTQTYYPYKNYSIPLDPDMSDLAVGFYEIMYRGILTDKILNSYDAFSDKEFAGDTMNSFNTIKNLSLEKKKEKDKLPKYLQDYHKQYHCLANFWLIPMNIGRTSKNTPCKYQEWSKTSKIHKTEDYMDKFLKLYKDNSEIYKDLYSSYFCNIHSFIDIARLHILLGNYIYENSEIYEFSNNDAETIVNSISDRIKSRATAISESKFAEELWEYFGETGLIVRHKGTYLDPDEYPLNKEIHPYAYECPMCNKNIINDENYSIPPACDECSKRDIDNCKTPIN